MMPWGSGFLWQIWDCSLLHLDPMFKATSKGVHEIYLLKLQETLTLETVNVNFYEWPCISKEEG